MNDEVRSDVHSAHLPRTNTPLTGSPLAGFPHAPLGHFPTALEPMSRLTDELRRSGSAPNLWIKRDDCTGLATGGNKTRKLEFILGDALRRNADTLLTYGALQSNHVRQTAAAAARYGLACKVVLERAVERDDDYEKSGNVLLDELLGAEIVDRVPGGTDMPAALHALAADLVRQGRHPYVIPVGGSDPVGALGYVDCALELAGSDLPVHAVVHGTGSGGTQAGLIVGFRIAAHPTAVLGVCVGRTAPEQTRLVLGLAQATMKHVGHDGELPADLVQVDDRFVGPGYAIPTPEMVRAVRLVARTEGVLLDPVYSGKAMAGLLTLVEEGRFGEDDNVVFLHTGGSVGLFGYRSAFEDHRP